MKLSEAILPVVALLMNSACMAAGPVLDNERITVWDSTEVIAHVEHDFVAVPLSMPGTALYGHQGEPAGAKGKRTIVIELKDVAVAPLANPGLYPPAFPRALSKKLFENDRVIVWSTRWKAGKPTPVHYHDKDAAVVFEAQGQLVSTTVDGVSTPVDASVGKTIFGPRTRTHSEVLLSGQALAVVTELK